MQPYLFLILFSFTFSVPALISLESAEVSKSRMGFPACLGGPSCLLLSDVSSNTLVAFSGARRSHTFTVQSTEEVSNRFGSDLLQ